MGDTEFSTLVQLLQHRAHHQPDRCAYTVLAENGSTEVSVTYRQLERQAQAIAARLQGLNAAGERVLLLYTTSMEYITSFFGCLYAGAVAVPAYPLRSLRPHPRNQAIAQDAQATVALTKTSTLPVLQQRVERVPEMKGLRCLGTSYPEPDEDADRWQPPTIRADTIAYLQYTSGSTASPKGVVLSHQNLLHNLAQIREAFRLGEEEVGVSWLPLYHDMGLIGGILLTLYAGARLVLFSPTEFAQHPLWWLQAISRYRATVSGGPSFAYQLCVDRITPEERATLDLASWKIASCGAEPVDPDVLERFSEAFAPCGFRPQAFWPSYGLAEATLVVSTKANASPPAVITRPRLSRGQGHVGENHTERRLVSNGQTLPGQRVVIVDPESLTPRLPGEVGEIWVSGPSVAQGYWNRTEETARTFEAFLRGSGEGPFLRTGDLGFLQDGELFISGRIKDVIIIRGLNYEPHDIELTAQQSHEALQPGGGAAFSVPLGGEERLVILHELKRTHRRENPEEIARAIRHAVAEEQELPVFAVALVKPGGIPRTSSGKVQHYLCRAGYMAGELETIAVSLLDAGQQAESLSPGYVPPRTQVEMALAQIWADVLNLGRVGIRDNFFALGGNSLMGTQVLSRLRSLFQIEIPLRGMFETPTVADLAAQIERALERRPLLHLPPLEAVDRDRPLPLSFAQERMWFLHRLDPESSAYNMPGALRLAGPLDREALEQSLHDILLRHEAFRTTFPAPDGQPVQVISPLAQPCLEVIDLRELPRPERESRAMQRLQKEARRPFDLGRGPLLRVLLVLMDDKDHILLFNMHHIISDAWSLGLLADDVLKLYNSYAAGGADKLPPLPIQYADFAVWQRQWLQGGELEALLAYWRKQLAGVPVLELPTDYPRPAILSYRGAILSSALSGDLMERLTRLSNREGVTLFMTLLAAFQVLLQRYTGQEDVAIGVPIANRNWLATESVVGSFVNTVVVRTDLSGDPTVRELLRRVREAALGAYAHQDMPYAKLIAEMQPERDTSRTPLAQVMFNVINVAMPALQLKDLATTPLEVDRLAAQFDLALTVADNEFMPQVSMEYSTDLFAADTVERMLGHFLCLLESLIADPSQQISTLPMLTAAERQRLVLDWNDTRAPYPEGSTLVQMFEAQAERTPEAPAFVCEGRQLTYGALSRQANQLAHYLQSLGVGPEVTVGVLLERSLDLVVALLAVLKAGGAYLPLDPGYPADRLAFMLQDSGAPILLTQEPFAARLPQHRATVVCLDADRERIAGQATVPPLSGTHADSLAYVLFTSGSTGRPKGVLGTYRGAVNLLAWMWNACPFQSGEVCCQRASAGFVDSIWEFFGPLLQGVPTVIIPDRVAADPQQLVQTLATHHVTRIVLVPSLLKAILDAHPDLQSCVPKLRIWLCGSEPLPVTLVRRFRQMLPDAVLWNLYGCSETAAFSTCYDTSQLNPDGLRVPIGRPIANTRAYLLDSALRPVPIGVPGELYLGGACPARGYLNNPELTMDRFVPDPFSDDPGARLYRTGDLGCYRPDGNIDYLGRRDHQVKVRGFRIELGEIEAVLRQHAAVAQAAVITLAGNPDTPGSPAPDQRLVACLVPAECTDLTGKELRAFLGSRLPAHMIPSSFLFLDAFPLSPNGKIDRLTLARLTATAGQDRRERVAPQSEIERRLIEIWEEVLGTQPVGIRDDFFELGGHSLLAARLCARIKEGLGVELPIATLFRAATVEQLAETLRETGGLPASPVLVPLQPGGSQPPFFCVHGLGGGVWGYAELARLLGPEQPFYGLQARGVEGEDAPHTRLEDMAAAYIEAMRSVQPRGPYRLGGYSAGGLVAFEMACQLHAQGEQVALLSLFDTYAPLLPGARRQRWNLGLLISFLRNLPLWLRDFWQREDKGRRLLARLRVAARATMRPGKRDKDHLLQDAMVLNMLGAAAEIPEERRRVVVAHLRAMEDYRPQVYAGKVTLIRVRGMRLWRPEAADLGWGELAGGGVEVREIPGAHYNILAKPHVDALAAELKAGLARIADGPGQPEP